MANLDATIERLRALPQEQQDALAAQIDLLLNQASEEPLSAEQWAAIETRLDSDEPMTAHADVVRAFRDRRG